MTANYHLPMAVLILLLLEQGHSVLRSRPSARLTVRSASVPRGEMKMQMQLDGSGVRQAGDAFGGRGLVAARSFAKGDRICTVPLSVCILARRDGVIANLVGQSDLSFDVVGDLRESTDPTREEHEGLTWDVRLAMALLESTSGGSLHRAGDFWDSYTSALPQPTSVTLPFCMKTSLLQQIQDETVIAGALAQKKRLSSFEELNDFDSHRITAYIESTAREHTPPPLAWAFAMVRSRCFQVSQDWFATVPIIEIANHCQNNPNAEFSVLGDELETGSCVLTATTAIKGREAILISYDSTSDSPYSNRRLFQQYGFVIEGNSAIDDTFLTDLVSPPRRTMEATTASTISDTLADILVDSAISISSNGPAYLSCRVESVSRALGVYIRRASQGTEGEKGSVIKSLLQPLLTNITVLEQQWGTTYEEDLALLGKLESSSSFLIAEDGTAVDTVDEQNCVNRQQFAACVRYRLDRKAMVLCAKAMVETALARLI